MNTSEALELAETLLSTWPQPLEIERPEANRLDARLPSPADLVPVAAGLRVKRLGQLSAMTGLDLGPEAGELEVLYHFCTAGAIITLRLRLPRDAAVVPTLSEIIPSAESFERELSEMFGVTVTGLAYPDHLYLPDDWPAGVYPLRKDTALQRLAANGHPGGQP